MIQYSKLAIFSANKEENTDERNLKLNSDLELILGALSIQTTRCKGVYKGTHENSLIAFIKNEYELSIIKSLCFDRYGQESVLYQDSTGISYLVYKNDVSNDINPIGRLTRVPKDEAISQDCYTVIEDHNGVEQYVIAK